jgi:hypothetical protein
MRRVFHLNLCCALLLLAACGGPPHPAIADLTGRENLSFFNLASIRGARDGDSLQAQAMFTDSSSILTIEMRFRIGSPTTLSAGTWQWTRNNRRTEGTLAARSVTFLGGQSGPPSIGGTFDLTGPDGSARYRVTIPVTELRSHGRR